MRNARRHYFPANGSYVLTSLLSTGMYKAVLEDPTEGWVAGYGPSRLSAIADMVERNGPAPEER
jgi:hypothetical protein